jgi:hypothetical protein
MRRCDFVPPLRIKRDMGTLRMLAAHALLGLAVTQSPAQAPAWHLPECGAAEYRRQCSAHSDVAETASAAQALQPRGAVPDDYLPRLWPAPILCQGELDRDQQAPCTPARDLRDLVRAIALDIGARGAGTWRFPRVPPFGDLVVTGRVGAVAADGTQEFDLTLDRRAPAALPGDDQKARGEIAQLCARELTGQLRIRRAIDSKAGVVREFTAELAVVVAEDKRHHRRIVVNDAWQLVAVHQNQDADFRTRVGAAVRAGAAWIRAAIEGLDATFLEDREGEHSFGSGRVALAVLTLLQAEVPPDDAVLQRAFAVLRKRKFVDTYAAATALMAMAQRYAPPREAELVRSGAQKTRKQRELPPADRALADKWLQRLLQNRDTRVDPDKTLRFDYDGGARYDNSLTQYGLLGLDAAALCGLEVAPQLWLAAADHFLAVQGPAHGRSLELDLLTHQELALAAGGPLPHHPQRTPVRGFSYQGPDEPAYGSLTAASTAGLVVARAGALQTGTATPAQLRALDDAVDAGFAWLAAEFTMRSNPGFVGRAHQHWYYWLYSLERACEFAGIARINGRDWYYEGALQLLAQQQKNGSFRADRGDTLLLESTCFAVLFLKKSTLAVLTGR